MWELKLEVEDGEAELYGKENPCRSVEPRAANDSLLAKS